MWKKKKGRAGQAQWQYGAWPLNAGTYNYKNTLRICNSFCFSTAPMVTRILLKCYVVLHCLSLKLVFSPSLALVSLFSVWTCAERYLDTRSILTAVSKRPIPMPTVNTDLINPYPTAFPYGNGMVLQFYQQQESSTTKTVNKVINKGLKTYV